MDIRDVWRGLALWDGRQLRLTITRGARVDDLDSQSTSMFLVRAAEISFHSRCSLSSLHWTYLGGVMSRTRPAQIDVDSHRHRITQSTRLRALERYSDYNDGAGSRH